MHAVSYTPITFFGNQVTRMNIGMKQRMPPSLGLGGGFVPYHYANDDIYLDVDFILSDTTIIGNAFLNGMFTISKIGDSHICKYCGAMVKAGTISCHRCAGDQTQVIPDSRYSKVVRATIQDYSHYWQKDGFTTISLRLGLIGGIQWNAKLGTNPSAIFNGWSTTHETDGWICKYCNSVIKGETLDCPNCGSGRVPFTDLRKMRMNCLYCGKPVMGNTVCDGCGATDNGYSMWYPRLDWN